MKDFKYIIKRIIIGTGIALALMLIKGNLLIGVFAKEVYSYNWGTHQFTPLLSATSSDFTLTSDPSLKNAGNGEILFTFNTYSGNNDKSPIVNNVRVYSGSTSYVCNFGTVNSSSSSAYTPSSGTSQSDNTSNSYSVVCPVNLGSDGLTRVAVFYLPYGSNVQDGFSITFSPYFSFIKDDDSTQDIINNANDNTKQQIESQKVCTSIQTSNSINIITGKGLSSTGVEIDSSNFVISPYFELTDDSYIKTISPYTSSYSSWNYCFYNANKEVLSCSSIASVSANQKLSIPNGSRFFRTSILSTANKPLFEIFTCKNGNQALADSQKDLNNTLNNSNVDSSSSEGSSFFEDFNDPHGATLSDIISLPLDFVNSLNNQCQPITLPIPHFGDLTLPCIKSYVSQFVPSGLINLISLVVNGFLLYRIVSSIIDFINQLKDPNNDDLEVMDL